MSGKIDKEVGNLLLNSISKVENSGMGKKKGLKYLRNVVLHNMETTCATCKYNSDNDATANP